MALVGGRHLISRTPRSAALFVSLLLVATTLVSASQPAGQDVGRASAGSRYWIPDDGLRDLMSRVSSNISEEFLRWEIENLTAFGTRYAHADNHAQVIDWIYNEFKAMGYEPEKWSFVHQGDGNFANVVVNISGTKDAGFYIICAHMDSMNRNYSWSYPNTPAPGADDDGTGIAALLAIAKVLREFRFQYGIRFIAFDGEELMGAPGSSKYAQMIKQNGEDLRGVLNVDMIGFNEQYLRLDIVYNLPSFDIFKDYIDPVNNEFYFLEYLDASEDPNNPEAWGDVDSFWDQGYPGVSFAENIYPRGNATHYKANPYYHTENDTLETLNMELVTRGVRLIACTLMWMAKPTIPDLVVKDLALPKGPVFVGDIIDVNVTVANVGDLDGPPVRVDLLVDGIWNSSQEISIPIGKAQNLTYRWSAVSGPHTFNITVDPLGLIGEWSEDNNTVSKELIVQIRPDIEVLELSVFEEVIDTGELATVSAKVRNNGPNYIECTFAVTDDMAPGSPVLSEFIALTSGSEWDKTFVWGSNVNGTHILEGRTTRCSPADRDPVNNVMSDTVRVNGFPIASLKAEPKEALTFQDMAFSGTSSYDDIEVAQWRFDFGDGNETGWTNVPLTKHNYTQDGTYTVTLTVQDASGAISYPVSIQVNVQDRPPVAIIKADKSKADTDAPISFSSTGSYDIDGKIVLYNWSFQPDGSTSSKANPTMTFAKPGNYTARLVILDDDGGMSTAALTFEVLNRQPKAVISGPRTVMVKSTAKFSAAGSSDPEGAIRSYQWDFGDGSKSPDKDTSHAFRTVGDHFVTLTVLDNNGGVDTVTLKVTVTALPVDEREPMFNIDYWVLGACGVVLLAVLAYTVAPGPRPPPKAMPRPRPRRKMRQGPKAKRGAKRARGRRR